jgi:tellurite resistance protein
MKAVLICANGDGTLAPEERDWAVGHSAAFGALDSLVDELKSYKADEDIEQIISATPESNACRRFLVYDAIRACSADGEYSDRERAMVIRMAAKLGLSEDLVRQIEEVCLEEARLREKRLKLVYPEGPPL